MADPHEACMVCEETRENHGDKHHQFSQDGSLVPIKPGTATTKPPPGKRTDGLVEAHLTGLVLRLIDRLVAKKLLSGEDLSIIFGGTINAPSARGQDDAQPPADHSRPTTQ